MESNQYKQTERFSVMAKGSDYFLSLDDKFKQKYKVEINNIQGYIRYISYQYIIPYQIKKEDIRRY